MTANPIDPKALRIGDFAIIRVAISTIGAEAITFEPMARFGQILEHIENTRIGERVQFAGGGQTTGVIIGVCEGEAWVKWPGDVKSVHKAHEIRRATGWRDGAVTLTVEGGAGGGGS